MASTADLITRSGDFAARMPDAGDQQETGRLAAAINTMLDRIQQSFAARLNSEQKVRQFAADASHELRTPLTTIRGYAELYRASALGPDELPSAMRRIEQEAERMSLLVAELLELARLDRPSSLDLSDTDLSVLARDAAADARAVEPDRTVRTSVPDSLVVTADEPRIRQVLANLLGNVRTHTPPGTPAAVRVYAAGRDAVIEVSDSGPGMSARDAARAFDRFHRGEGALAAASAGRPRADAHDGTEVASSGLGLSIVQAIATAHGGQADLSSAPGQGTTVRLRIPVRDQPAGRLEHAELDRHVAAGGPRVGADLVGRLGELTHLVALHPGNVDDQRDAQAEGIAVGTDADLRGDGRVAERRLPAARGQAQRAVEAGGVAGREQLLGVGPRAGAAELGRQGQVQVDPAVRGGDVAVPAVAGRGRLGRVQHLVGHARNLIVMCPVWGLIAGGLRLSGTAG
jgi:signal transduction histidine kinase